MRAPLAPSERRLGAVAGALRLQRTDTCSACVRGSSVAGDAGVELLIFVHVVIRINTYPLHINCHRMHCSFGADSGEVGAGSATAVRCRTARGSWDGSAPGQDGGCGGSRRRPAEPQHSWHSTVADGVVRSHQRRRLCCWWTDDATMLRKDLKRGELTGTGEPTVLKDTGAVVCWDGAAGWPDRPPMNGLYTTAEAVNTAVDRSFEHGVATVIVRRSSHTGCLQAFLEAATSRQCMVIIASCGPGVRSVAPHGGTTGTLHPNPFAVGIPSSPVPILVDMSVKTTFSRSLVTKKNIASVRLHCILIRVRPCWLPWGTKPFLCRWASRPTQITAAHSMKGSKCQASGY